MFTTLVGRRALLKSAGALALTSGVPRLVYAANPPAQTARVNQTVSLTPGEQLLHTTVRIVCPLGDDSYESGTGFLFNFFSTPQNGVPAIVTNKHVVANRDLCLLIFTGAKADGSPDINSKLSMRLEQFSKRWIAHPDPSVDLVVIPIGDVIQFFDNKGTPVFYRAASDSSIPDASAFADLSPIEDILTVGFPGQVWDEAHNLPVFHRGITASPPYVDFQGRREFLIDSAVWPGASGSPVFLYEQGTLYNSRQNNVEFGTRLFLLGIVYGTAVQDITGALLIETAPTKPTVHSGIPSNLGLCIRSTRIFDFQPLLLARGAKLPPDYKLRTADS